MYLWFNSSLFSEFRHLSLLVLFFSEKHTYNGLPELMTRVASSELRNLDENINECNVIYLPQVSKKFINRHVSIFVSLSWDIC